MRCYCPVVYPKYVKYKENQNTGGQAFVCCQHLNVASLGENYNMYSCYYCIIYL